MRLLISRHSRAALLATCVAIMLSGCSAQQSQKVGMRGNTVTSTPQQMTNLEICETYAYGRKTTQSRFAIASEWSRRGINRQYCEKIRGELFITTLMKKIANMEEKPGSRRVKPVQPVDLR